MSHALSATSLRLRIGDRQLLDGVELRAEPGEMVAVVGPSGSGKTTLLLVLAGVLLPDSGEVSYPSRSPEASAQVRIGLVPQTIGLAANLTAAENVALPLQAAGLERDEMRARTEQVLTELGLGSTLDRLVTDLSGGQRQRVAVARALAGRPEILLADEATAELDGEHQVIVMDLFARRAAEGAAIVVTTHDELVAERCDRVLALEDGRLAPSGAGGG